MGAKTVFFSLFWFYLLKMIFLMFAETLENMGSTIVCVLVVQREEEGKNIITGISGFGFFLSKNGHFVTVNCFCFFGLLKPLIYIVFLGCAPFGPSCQKRHFLDQKKEHWKVWRFSPLFLPLEEKCLFFTLKGYFCLFCSVSRCFSLAFCLTSLFHSLSLSLPL